jgi:hypothetical protein
MEPSTMVRLTGNLGSFVLEKMICTYSYFPKLQVNFVMLVTTQSDEDVYFVTNYNRKHYEKCKIILHAV